MKTSKFHLASGFALALAALLASPAGTARAELIYGLTNTGGLLSFDSATPATQTSIGTISGVSAGQTLSGIDFRPATGQLYGLGYNQSATTGTNAQVYTIGTASGVATPVGSPISLAFGLNNARMGFDFNPTVDRIRVVFGDSISTAQGGNDANYRLVPTTGALAFTDTSVFYGGSDSGAGTDPIIAGAAYTNNFAGATSTTLYALDFARSLDTIVTIGGVGGTPSPNAGQLFTVGSTGFAADSAETGFDISGATGAAYLNARVGGVENLYTINLGTGAATIVGNFGATNVLDIAVAIPEPSTYALCALGLGALMFGAMRRRRVAA